MFFLLEVENEENVLVCLRIIIDLHKQFRPSFSTEVSDAVGVHMYLLNEVLLLSTLILLPTFSDYPISSVCQDHLW